MTSVKGKYSVLAVGIATIDIISVVEQYPAANDEVRASQRYIQRGGNACNTLVVLSQLGCECSWAGTLAKDPWSISITQDLDAYCIDQSAVVRYEGASPLSCITLDSTTGSRTIVHYRDLPELDFNNFKKQNFSQFDWIHFEGRNVEQTLLMLKYISSLELDISVSLEVEKNREGIASLFGFADIVIFSKNYVTSMKQNSAIEFLQNTYQATYKAMFCPWGDEGAWGINKTGLYHSPAIKLENVEGTTGAGDVFNAGVINSMLNDMSLQACLDSACKLAARKCGRKDFDLKS